MKKFREILEETFSPKPNGIIVEIEDELHFFWMKDDEVVNPSIPIGDPEDGAYSGQGDDCIQFVRMELELKPGKTFRLDTADDWDRFTFVSTKMDRIYVEHDGEPASVHSLMKAGMLNEFVGHFMRNSKYRYV
jgi:hypothetical protein